MKSSCGVILLITILSCFVANGSVIRHRYFSKHPQGTNQHKYSWLSWLNPFMWFQRLLSKPKPFQVLEYKPENMYYHPQHTSAYEVGGNPYNGKNVLYPQLPPPRSGNYQEEHIPLSRPQPNLPAETNHHPGQVTYNQPASQGYEPNLENPAPIVVNCYNCVCKDCTINIVYHKNINTGPKVSLKSTIPNLTYINFLRLVIK